MGFGRKRYGRLYLATAKLFVFFYFILHIAQSSKSQSCHTESSALCLNVETQP